MKPLFRLRPGVLAPALCLAAMLSACGGPAAAPDSGWTIERLGERWSVTGFEESKDLSGIAAYNDTHCLVGTDELIVAQHGEIDRKARVIRATGMFPLLANPTGKKMEVDIEGVAVDRENHCYYVTGSHGVSKKKGEYDPARASVFRVPVDPATGKANESGIRQASLMPWLEQSAEFADYVRKPLQQNGFNIEGVTFRDGTLFFGVRGPNVDGDTWVIEVKADALFSDGIPAAKAHPLPVGEGRGIREITAIRDGFLVITGNASAEPSKQFPQSLARSGDSRFELFLWQPGTEQPVKKIGLIPAAPAKAEALLVLEDRDDSVDVLILFDGAVDGAPGAYRITRRKS